MLKPIRSNKIIDFVIGALFCATVLSIGYAALILRPLIIEGAQWLFFLVHQGKAQFDPRLMRYADLIFQVPSLLIVNFISSPEKVAWAVRAYCFSYLSQGVIGLTACYFVLRRSDNLKLILFPLISFSSAYLSCVQYAPACVAGINSAAWPLFFLLFLKTDKRNYFLIAPLTLFLLFNHESSIFFFTLFLAMEVFEIYRQNRWRNLRSWSVPATFLACIFFLTYRLLQAPSTPISIYQYQLNFLSDIQIVNIILIVGGILLFLNGRMTRSPRLKLYASVIIWLMIFGGFFYELSQLTGLPDIISVWKSIDNRVLAPVFAVVILTVCYVQMRFFSTGAPSPTESYLPLKLLLILSLITGLIWDLKVTRAWQESLNFIRSQSSSSAACKITNLSDNRFFSLPEPLLPAATALVNSTEFGRPGTILMPSSRVYREISKRTGITDICCLPAADFFPVWSSKWVQISKSNGFRFEELKEHQRQSPECTRFINAAE